LGIADTGIEQNSCFFVDSDNGNVDPSPTSSPIVDYSKRFVIPNLSKSSETYYGTWFEIGKLCHMCLIWTILRLNMVMEL